MDRISQPQPGPQTTFVSSPCDVVFYGGMAGGGKTYAAVVDAARWMGVRGYKGLMVRRTFPELMGADGLFDIAADMLRGVPGIRIVESSSPEISLPRLGSRLLFRHMQHEKSKTLHQGAQYATIHADEVTGLSDTQFWYLYSRNRTTCGIRPYMRAMCNPEPGWVADLIDWWIDSDGFVIPERSGVVRYMRRNGDGDIVWSSTHDHRDCKSFTFILAKLDDNTYLGDEYRASLAMLDRVEYARKGLGNWKAVPTSGDYFQRMWCPVVYDAPPDEQMMWVRGWDKAASESPKADWTVGVRYGRHRKTGKFYLDLRSVVRMQKGPGDVLTGMETAAERDGVQTLVGGWQDPAQAGVVDVMTTRKALSKFTFLSLVASKAKLHYWKPFTVAAQAGDVILIRRKDHREPNAAEFLSCLEAQGGEEVKHDDDMDAVACAHQHVHNAGPLGYTPAPAVRSRFMLD